MHRVRPRQILTHRGSCNPRGAGAEECTECESTGGYISVAGESGATSCTLCGPVSYADEPNHVCADCPAQTYSTFGVDECLVCPSAVYKSKQLTGQSSCDPCPPGTLNTLTTCLKCDSGTIAELYQTECTLCDGVGEYSDVQGGTYCKTWPKLLYIPPLS